MPRISPTPPVPDRPAQPAGASIEGNQKFDMRKDCIKKASKLEVREMAISHKSSSNSHNGDFTSALINGVLAQAKKAAAWNGYRIKQQSKHYPVVRKVMS